MTAESTVRFLELVRRQEADIPLDEAALLIAAHGRPGLDVDAEMRRLDDLAASVAAPTLGALVTKLFVDDGFAGDTVDYSDPRNSYLDQVVSRRLGIPITLCVLAMEVGRRAGVGLVGVGMPGHFLARSADDPDVFVDCFAGGRILDAAGVEQRFTELHGAGAAFDRSFLQPVGPRPILARMLANLRASFVGRGDLASAVWALRLRVGIPGLSTSDLREQATALAAVGQFGDAATVLEDLGDGHDALTLRSRLN